MSISRDKESKIMDMKAQYEQNLEFILREIYDLYGLIAAIDEQYQQLKNYPIIAQAYENYFDLIHGCLWNELIIKLYCIVDLNSKSVSFLTILRDIKKAEFLNYPEIATLAAILIEQIKTKTIGSNIKSVYSKIQKIRNEYDKGHFDKIAAMNLMIKQQIYDQYKPELSELQEFIVYLEKTLLLIAKKMHISFYFTSRERITKEIKKLFLALNEQEKRT